VAELRAALLDAITPEDVAAIIRALIAQARDGDIPAIRELFDRVFGRPAQSIAGDLSVSLDQTALTPEQQARADEIVRRIDAIDD